MTETKSKLNIPLAILVILLCIPMQYYYSDTFGLSIGGFTVEYKYFFASAIIIIALFYVLARPQEFPFYGRTAGDAIILWLPMLVTLLISILIWVFSISDFKQITRGISQTLYRTIVLMTGLSLVILFREKAVFVHLISMIAAYGLLCFSTWYGEYGFSTIAGDYLKLVTSLANTTPKSMMKVEYHDMCFGFGLYMTYFLICQKPRAQKIKWFLIALFAFSFGIKRIVLPAAAIAVLFWLIGTKLPKDMKTAAVKFFGILLILLAWGYILLIHRGIAELVTNALNINTMRRNEIYDYFKNYYSLSPAFTGYGLGYVERFIESLPPGLFITALHNDILKMYMELGFFGFLIWLVVNYVSLPSFFMNRRDSSTCLVYFGLAAFCFVTYLTDNTYVYFILNLATFTSILSCACYQPVENAGKDRTAGS